MAQEELIIKAENRTVKGKQVKALRRAGYLPGVIYGRHLEAFPIQMNAHEVSLKLSKLSSSSLITITQSSCATASAIQSMDVSFTWTSWQSP